MKRKLMIIYMSLLMFISASMSFAQEGGRQWKTGDKVEILNLSKEWVPGTILGTVDWNGKLMYRVQLDDASAPTVYFNHTPPAEIRARNGGNAQPAGNPTNNQRAEENPAPPAGDEDNQNLVDVFYNEKQGKNRGTIIETANGKYKIHYTGCAKTWDEWVDRSLIRSAAQISADAPEIRFLIGKWSLTAVGMSSAAIAWGKLPGIQINGNGTYVWYQDGGKPPVKGSWRTDAKVTGADSGTQKYDGILVRDADGQAWKIFKWTVKGSDEDGIEVQKMCSGISDVGRRVR